MTTLSQHKETMTKAFVNDLRESPLPNELLRLIVEYRTVDRDVAYDMYLTDINNGLSFALFERDILVEVHKMVRECYLFEEDLVERMNDEFRYFREEINKKDPFLPPQPKSPFKTLKLFKRFNNSIITLPFTIVMLLDILSYKVPKNKYAYQEMKRRVLCAYTDDTNNMKINDIMVRQRHKLSEMLERYMRT